MVAYAFAVVQKVVQYKPKLYRAAARLQALYVAALYLADEHVYHLLQRFNVRGLFKIVIHKRIY